MAGGGNGKDDSNVISLGRYTDMRRSGVSGSGGEGRLISLDTFRKERQAGPAVEPPANIMGAAAQAREMPNLEKKDAENLVHLCKFSEDPDLRMAALNELIARKDCASLLRCMGSTRKEVADGAFEAVRAMNLRNALLNHLETHGAPAIKQSVLRVFEADADKLIVEGAASPLIFLAQNSQSQEVRVKAAGYFIGKKDAQTIEHLAVHGVFPDVRNACQEQLVPELDRYARKRKLGVVVAIAKDASDQKLRFKAMDALYKAKDAGDLQVLVTKAWRKGDVEHARELVEKLKAQGYY